MGALDPAKIVMILVIALIVLGPDKLPRVARQLGAAWRMVGEMRTRLEQEVHEAIPDLDLPRLPARPGAAVSGFLADLVNPRPEEPPAAMTAVSAGGEPIADEGTAAGGEPVADERTIAATTAAWRSAGGSGPAQLVGASQARVPAPAWDDPGMN